jgi:hypothetical protein
MTMVGQVVAEHKPSRQIGPAAAWRKHLRGHGILEVKLHQDCLQGNMRNLSRAPKGYIFVPALAIVDPGTVHSCAGVGINGNEAEVTPAWRSTVSTVWTRRR